MAALQGWPLFNQEVRVCWSPLPGGGNCGRCEKCLRTTLGYLAVSGTVPPALPNDPEMLRQAVREIKVNYKARVLWQEILDWAREHNRDGDWRPLLESKCRLRWKERRHGLRDEALSLLRRIVG